MLKSIKNNRGLYFIWMFSIILISFSPLVSGVSSVVALVLVGSVIAFGNKNDSIVLLFGMLPFANIFKIAPGSMSFFTVCIILYVFVRMVKEMRMNKTMLIMTIVFLLYIMLFSQKDANILTIIKVIVGFYLIYYANFLFKKDIKNIVYLLSFSTILMMLLSSNKKYFLYVEPYLDDMNYYIDTTGHATDIMRNSGFIGDPNYCAVLIMITLTLLAVLYYYKEINNEFWFINFLLVPMGFLTYSKSYFLCITMYVVILVVFVLFPKHKVWAGISIIGIIFLIGFILNGKFEVINLILDRFTSDDITTGRSSLNHDYMKYIMNNVKVLFWGEGLCVERIAGFWNNVHNFYIDLFFKLGILGSMVYCSFLYVSLRRSIVAKRKEKKNIVGLMPLMFMAVMFYFLAGVLNYAFPFYVIITQVGYNYTSIPSE